MVDPDKVLGRTSGNSAQNLPNLCPEFGKTTRHKMKKVWTFFLEGENANPVYTYVRMRQCIRMHKPVRTSV